MAECDDAGREVFRERYGFARSSRYVLRHAGKDYDPAPIVAVAHREQHGRVLKSSEVKAPHRVLERLGLEVIPQTPPWREDEMLLALELYLHHRGKLLGNKHPEVLALSRLLRQLAPLQGRVRDSKYRNPEGVAQQVGKFLNLDPLSTKKGRGSPSKLHETIWNRFAEDTAAFTQALSRIHSSMLGHVLETGEGARDEKARRTVRKVPREELFAPFGPEAPDHPRSPAAPIELDSTKQDAADAKHDELRIELQRFLLQHGFQAHNSVRQRPGGGEVIQFDLAATRGPLSLVVEVKSLPVGGKDHDVLRRGLGQLLWYRSRWWRVAEDPCVAVLYIERQPVCAEQWRLACKDVHVVLSWEARRGTLIAECEAIAALRQASTPRGLAEPGPPPAPAATKPQTPPR